MAKLRRDNGIRRHRQSTFKLSKYPAFAEEAVAVAGLYLAPPGGTSCSALTRRLAPRRWTTPRRSHPWTPAQPRIAPRLQAPRPHDPLARENVRKLVANTGN